MPTSTVDDIATGDPAEEKFSSPRLFGEARAFTKRVAVELEIITGDPEALSLAVDLMVRYCMRLGDPKAVAVQLLAAAEEGE